MDGRRHVGLAAGGLEGLLDPGRDQLRHGLPVLLELLDVAGLVSARRRSRGRDSGQEGVHRAPGDVSPLLAEPVHLRVLDPD